MRRFNGVWQFLAIRPLGKSNIWALPKGHIDGVESEQEAALREVFEETGVRVRLDEKLGDINYQFRVENGKIHKKVSFFLLLWTSGSPVPQAAEVEEVRWFDLDTALDSLSYHGEREIAIQAAESLALRSTSSRPATG